MFSQCIEGDGSSNAVVARSQSSIRDEAKRCDLVGYSTFTAKGDQVSGVSLMSEHSVTQRADIRYPRCSQHLD